MYDELLIFMILHRIFNIVATSNYYSNGLTFKPRRYHFVWFLVS